MTRLSAAFIAALLALAAPANAQIPSNDDPMMWAYDYAYFRAICDSATPRERADRGTRSRRGSDASESCQQAVDAKEHLKRKGYWCVTNAAADIGVPCTPGLAKKTGDAPAAPAQDRKAVSTNTSEMTCQGVLRQAPNSEDRFRVGTCTFAIDQYTGVVIDEKCRIGRPCTVRATVKRDNRGLWIIHADSAQPGR
jgi:hypothetical protein